MIIVNRKQSLISRMIFALILSFAITNAASANELSLDHTNVLKDSIVIKRTSCSKHRNARIYPGLTHENLIFTASGKQGKSYQLFLFNMNGKLIKQSRIHEKQTAVLSEMEKGNYLFELFNDDLRIENGSIVIK